MGGCNCMFGCPDCQGGHYETCKCGASLDEWCDECGVCPDCCICEQEECMTQSMSYVRVRDFIIDT